MFDKEVPLLLRRNCEHTLDDKIRPENTHGGDTNTGLGCAVRSTEAGEDDGSGAPHGTKEGLLSCMSVYREGWIRIRDRIDASDRGRHLGQQADSFKAAERALTA